MKKLIIMFAILLIPALSLQSGIRVGAKAGLNLSKASFNTDVIKTNNFTGFQIGPIVELSGLTGLGVDASILYSQQGFEIKRTSHFNYKEKVRALDVPVNLKMKFSVVDILGCYVSAGPYISFKLDDKVSFNKIKMQWKNKQFGVGLNFGAGVELFKDLQVGANYQIALNDDYSNFSSDDLKNLNAKSRIWSITTAYFF